MSIDTLDRRHLAGGDDGSRGDGRANWDQWADELSGIEGYVMQDVGLRRVGRAAMPGFAEDFHSDRQMPRHMRPGEFVTQAALGPDYHIS